MAEQTTENHVRRLLKTRHLSMIALGGSIGTGLFIASGSALHTAGPGGANGYFYAHQRIICLILYPLY